MRFNYWVLGAVLTVLFTAGYFFFNPSYERSLQAKFYYAIGDYRHAQALASEAFAMNSYNRMAATVMTQSQTALKFVEYIEEGREYMAKITEIAKGDGVSQQERARIKMMCDIMVDSFESISATVVTDASLVQEATAYRDKFKKLRDEIIK